MRLKFGQHFRVNWYDAFASAEWTDDKKLAELIKDSTPETQYQYIDIPAMPKGWIVELKPVR